MTKNQQPSRRVPPSARLAGFLKVGDKVGVVELQEEFASEVVEIERVSSTLVAYGLSNGSRHEAIIGSELNFPRREDGETVDWVHRWAWGTTEGLRSPMWHELRSGDRIPDPYHPLTYRRPFMDRDPEGEYHLADEEGKRDLLEEYFEGLEEFAWTFVRMNRPRSRDGFWVATFIIPTTGEVKRLRVAYLPEYVLTPTLDKGLLEPAVKREPKQERPMTQYAFAGPYRRLDEQGLPTGRIALFAIKEGPGRWSSGLREYDADGEGRMRPPTGTVRSKSDMLEWAFWRLEADGVPHPHDSDVVEKWDDTARRLQEARENPGWTEQDVQHD